MNQIQKNKQNINRLLAQKAALSHKIKTQENHKRKARTRTLIQLGGLINLTPLLTLCKIELGEDLQSISHDKAATLLGLLTHMCDQLPENIALEEFDNYKIKGKILLNQK